MIRSLQRPTMDVIHIWKPGLAVDCDDPEQCAPKLSRSASLPFALGGTAGGALLCAGDGARGLLLPNKSRILARSAIVRLLAFSSSINSSRSGPPAWPSSCRSSVSPNPSLARICATSSIDRGRTCTDRRACSIGVLAHICCAACATCAATMQLAAPIFLSTGKMRSAPLSVRRAAPLDRMPSAARSRRGRRTTAEGLARQNRL
eukprot:SAG31_NODE_4726_length_3005_cov_6.928424_5_plen_204_part_00